jgi:hypothetical protein
MPENICKTATKNTHKSKKKKKIPSSHFIPLEFNKISSLRYVLARNNIWKQDVRRYALRIDVWVANKELNSSIGP